MASIAASAYLFGAADRKAAVYHIATFPHPIGAECGIFFFPMINSIPPLKRDCEAGKRDRNDQWGSSFVWLASSIR
jgi:hypothetical protein